MMTAMQRPPKPLTVVREAEVLPTFDARDLVENGTQARLVLDDQTYFLRITRAGKLILTK
ncbi:hypothetical protein NBRC116593_32120 [Sulfitobacter pacificus]